LQDLGFIEGTADSAMSKLYSLALDAAAGVSVAELHGTVVGFLSVTADEDRTLFGVMDVLGDEVSGPSSADTFVREAARDLSDEAMGFTPLLPDDDEPLEHRLECLVEWVSGFLAALGIVIESKELPEDVDEGVQDMITISHVEAYSEGSERDEEDYVTLVEFVRVGTFIVQSNFAGLSEGDA
jgi:uncharacterized protein YgfB (UPF0149 family)